MNSPSFVFGTDYNNPNIYDAYNHSNSLAGGGAAVGKNYFKNDASGYLVQSGLSLPIREFDIVVEAHDTDGRTSVGNSSIKSTKNSNKVYDNTINTATDSSEMWNYRLGGYDILGCYIQPISGIVFPSSGNLLDSQFVSPEEAFNRDYPYLASMKTFPDGHSKLAIDESESSQEGNFILTQTQIDDIFAEAAGIVFYYTTGNEDLIEVHKTAGDVTTPVVNRIAQWRAPQFTIDQNAITGSISGRHFGNIEAGTAAQTGASVLIEPKEYNTTNPDNSTVFRDYRLLEPGQKVSEFLFQFAKSKVVSVDNAQFCIGAFDQLSYLAHFNDDGSPKTKTVTYTRIPPQGSSDPTATQEIPTIFTDGSIEFSKLATDTAVVSPKNNNVSFGGNSNGRFQTTQSPTSFLVVEESMLTTKDKDLSFKAWCDFSFEPLKVSASNESKNYWHVKKPDFFIKYAGSETRSWQLSHSLSVPPGDGVNKANSMAVGSGLTKDIKQIAANALIGRNIKNVQIIENSFNGVISRPVHPETGLPVEGISKYPKLATTIEIEFYEPLNSIAMPTPILQIYSDFRDLDDNGNILSDRRGYTQPTPTPRQVRDTVNLKDGVGEGTDTTWAASNISTPPPTVSLLETNENQSSVRLLVEYGNESTFDFNSELADPVIPSRIKIVVGFLENSYNRHV
jgi:hypothetical protein